MTSRVFYSPLLTALPLSEQSRPQNSSVLLACRLLGPPPLSISEECIYGWRPRDEEPTTQLCGGLPPLHRRHIKLYAFRKGSFANLGRKFPARLHHGRKKRNPLDLVRGCVEIGWCTPHIGKHSVCSLQGWKRVHLSHDCKKVVLAHSSPLYSRIDFHVNLKH